MNKVYYELPPERIALLKNPTEEGAVKFIRDSLHIPNPNPKNALAGLHKARLSWNGSSPEMIEESKKWLVDNGFSPTPSPYVVGSE